MELCHNLLAASMQYKKKCLSMGRCLNLYRWKFYTIAPAIIWIFLGTATSSEPNHSNPIFSRPASIETRVKFWKKIYTEVTTDYGYLHDTKDLSVIYETVRVGNSSGHILERQLKPTRRYYRNILRELATGKRADLSTEQARILKLFPPNVSNRTLIAASKRVRFQLGQANRFRNGLQRMGRWEPFIRDTLQNHGIPEELVALPLVESSFNPTARSHAGASGLWQFTRSTGRRFLRVNHFIDERRDPFLSTRAAAKLLKRNYESIGTWPLAITAYNHGAAGVRRAKKKLRTTDIQTITERYKGRTFGFASKNFYAEFLAASDILENVANYFPALIKEHSERRNIVFLNHFYRIEDLTRGLGVTKEEVRKLNPALLSPIWRSQKLVPKGYALRIPAGLNAAEKIAALPRRYLNKRQIPDANYRVRRGDTLSVIARRFGVSETSLIRANGIRNKNRIRTGQRLKIPGKAISKAPSDIFGFSYKVQRGDTLEALANRYNTTITAIATANKLKDRNQISAGQIFTIPGIRVRSGGNKATNRIYTVKKGDSLSRIAKRHSITVKVLAKANKLTLDSIIHPGQRLRVNRID